MRRLTAISLLALLVVITSAAFLPSLKNGFVNWDDGAYVIDNPLIKSLSWGSARKIFSSFHQTNYHPLALLSYALEYHFFGLNPRAYHATNLILHLLNCLLVFWFIFLLSKSAPVSFITAVFFGIHPLHVESVAWVAERRDVLYALFFFGALISYLYYKKNKLAKFYYLSLFLFLLALFSKVLAVSFPLVLLLCEYFLRDKPAKGGLKEKAPYFVLAILFAGVTFAVRYNSGDIQPESTFHIFYNFFLAAHGVIFYLVKAFFPLNLCARYPNPADTVAMLPWQYLASALAAIVLVAGALFFYRHTRKVIFGALFYLCTLLPAVQLVHTISAPPVADRYSYVPLIGIFYLAAEGFVWLYRKIHKYGLIIRPILLSLLIAAICALSFLTAGRCLVWKDGLSFWTDVLRQYPDNLTPTIGINLSNAYYRAGQYEKAMSLAARTVKLYPHSPYLYINIGNAYSFAGKTEEGINWYKKAIVIDPNLEKAYFNLAFAYNKIGKKQEAIESYKKAIEIQPGFAEAYADLGVVYQSLGSQGQALSMLEKAIEVNPAYFPAYPELISLYKSYGRKEEIISLYQKAVAHQLPYFEAYFQVAVLYSDMGRDRKAIELLERAVKLEPRSAEAYANLGSAWCAVGNYNAAIKYLTKAIELDSRLAVAYNNLSLAYYYAKKYALAIQNYERAVELGYQVQPKLGELLGRQRK